MITTLGRHRSDGVHLFDRLFAKSDPTRAWTAQPGLKVVLDLDKHTVCGIGLGDPVDRIAKLGTPDNLRPTKYEDYDYHKLGLSINAKNGVVNAFEFTFDPEAAGYEEDVTPFAGATYWQGRTAELGASVPAADFVGRFGEPYWRDEDEDETLLFYEFGGVEW